MKFVNRMGTMTKCVPFLASCDRKSQAYAKEASFSFDVA